MLPLRIWAGWGGSVSALAKFTGWVRKPKRQEEWREVTEYLRSDVASVWRPMEEYDPDMIEHDVLFCYFDPALGEFEFYGVSSLEATHFMEVKAPCRHD